MWPFSFQITAQSGAVQISWGFPISEGEKDIGVEYEPGACDGKDRSEQQSTKKAFGVLVDLCLPAGQKL